MRARLRRPRCASPSRPNWVQAPATSPTPSSKIDARPIAIAVLLIVALAGVESRRLHQQQKQQAGAGGATVPTATQSDPWAIFTAHSVLPVPGEAPAANQSPFLSQGSSAPDDPAVQQDPETAADAENAENTNTSAPGFGAVAAQSQPTAPGGVERGPVDSDAPTPPSEAVNTTAASVPGGSAAATAAAPAANTTSATLPPQPLQPHQPPSSNASTVPPALLDTAVRIITGDAGALALAQQQSAPDGDNVRTPRGPCVTLACPAPLRCPVPCTTPLPAKMVTVAKQQTVASPLPGTAGTPYCAAEHRDYIAH